MTRQTKHKSIRIDHRVTFIADTHFMHASMVSTNRRDKAGNLLPQLRKFDTIAEHDEALIEAWNDSVSAKDTVYHLGDFGFWKSEVEDLQRIFKKLNGTKILIPGNHDTIEACRLGWHEVLPGVVHWTDADGAKIVGSHHPQREWDGWHNGALHVHGHVHGNLPNSRRSFDIGVDSMGRWPLSMTDIRAYMSSLPELDFTGVETEEFVPGQDDEEAAGPTP
jgi:calcineurin-like phosphoesterase family protein